MKKRMFLFRQSIIVSFVTLFYVGFVPFFSGTLGSLVTVLCFCYLHYLLKDISFIVIVVQWVIVTGLAIPACSYAEKNIFLTKDSSKIVIDEYSGMVLSLLPILYLPWQDSFFLYYMIAFLLFRFFDISKILGINYLQKFKGGVGVMIDDLLAGLYSLLIMIVLLYIIKLN